MLRDLSGRMAAGTIRAVQAPIIGVAAAHLVQPRTAQHAVPRARPDRLHLDDYRRGLDGAVDRPREGDAARWSRFAWRRSRRLSFVARQDTAVSRAVADLRRSSSSSRRWVCSICRCAATGCTLSLVVAVFLVGALGTGLLVSTIADTQQVAFQAAMLIAFLPTFMLSGFIFPIASMPVAPAIHHDDRARRSTSWSRCVAWSSRDSSLHDAVAADRRAGDLRRGRPRPVVVEAGAPMMRRIRTLMRKEFLELRQTPRLLRPDHRRADRAADACWATPRRPTSRTCPIVIVDGDRVRASRRAHRTLRRVAVLRDRRRKCSGPRDVDDVPRAGAGVARDRDSARASASD